MLTNGANTDALGFDDRTAPYVAAELGHTGVVKSLLAAGADDSVRCGLSAKAALLVASEYGHVDAMEAFIEHGVDVSAVSRNRSTALHYAARKNHGDVIDVIVDAGAKVHARNAAGVHPFTTEPAGAKSCSPS